MIKKTDIQKLSLGIFIIIGTLLFVFTVYTIGKKQHLFGNNFIISTHFQNINGLQKGNSVRFSGINIGTISAIKMINDSTIKIDMNIDEKITTHIKKDAIATIGSDGLVGNMIINIIPGKSNAPKIREGDVITSYSRIGTDDILNTLSATNENASLLMSDLLKITNSIIEGKGTFGVLLNDTIMARDLKQSITNLKYVSQKSTTSINELNKMIISFKTNKESIAGVLLNDTIAGHQLKNMVGNLSQSSMKIDSVITNLNVAINHLNNGKGTANLLLKDTTLARELKASIKNINSGTYKFDQNMEALKHNFLFKKYFKNEKNKN